MEDVKVREWLKDNPKDYGDGYGSGYDYGDGSSSGSGFGDGSGSGSGFGFGDGSGSGFGFGDGSGSGSGFGSSSGSGFGDGSGFGFGSSSGFGDGDGSSSGFGIKSFRKDDVHIIDHTQTIITYIKDSVAKGFILYDDLTLSPCFVVKGHGYFAHGKTLKEANDSLMAKIYDDMDTEEVIEEFMKKFKKGETYPGTDFFEWHHYLTGSCLMGRESFVKNRGLDVNATYTVDEFIDICKDAYGGEVIKELKERWDI